jgi:hypothetical protein
MQRFSDKIKLGVGLFVINMVRNKILNSIGQPFCGRCFGFRLNKPSTAGRIRCLNLRQQLFYSNEEKRITVVYILVLCYICFLHSVELFKI